MTDIYVGIDPGSKNCALVAWSPTEGLISRWKPKAPHPTGVLRLQANARPPAGTGTSLARRSQIRRALLRSPAAAITDGLISGGKAPHPTGVLRLRKLTLDLQLELNKLAQIGRIAMIAMEAYSMAEKYGQHASGEVGGAIKLAVLTHFGARGSRGYPVLVAPQQLKKFATGNGNTKKELITKEVLKRWEVDFDDTNLAEAFVLAQMAYAYDVHPEMTAFQQEVIKKLAGRSERAQPQIPGMPLTRSCRWSGSLQHPDLAFLSCQISAE